MSPLAHTAYAPFIPVEPGSILPMRSSGKQIDLYYIPGTVCAVAQESKADFSRALVTPPSPAQTPEARASVHFLQQYADFRCRLKALECEPYKPKGLTLFLNNRCNLACTYCHVFGRAGPEKTTLSEPAIACAARQVASHCAASGQPMWIVFHGGGEPTMESDTMEYTLLLRRKIAQEFGISIKTYLATNGILSPELATRLGAGLDVIGLSCDGPAHIHDTARPRLDGSASLKQIITTGTLLSEATCELQIRTTIRRNHIREMREIAEYLCHTFRPSLIRFEPAYEHGNPDSEVTVKDQEDALLFAEGFFAARQDCRKSGVELDCSLLMPQALRGPYCNINRQSLNLIPGDYVTACFKHSRAEPAARSGFLMGRYNSAADALVLDEALTQKLQENGRRIPARCQTCFNQYHCTFSCPDYCVVENHHQDPLPDYRCYVQQTLCFEEIVRTGQSIANNFDANCRVGIQMPGRDQAPIMYRDAQTSTRP